jgi:hypothetical protein
MRISLTPVPPSVVPSEGVIAATAHHHHRAHQRPPPPEHPPHCLHPRRSEEGPRGALCVGLRAPSPLHRVHIAVKCLYSATAHRRPSSVRVGVWGPPHHACHLPLPPKTNRFPSDNRKALSGECATRSDHRCVSASLGLPLRVGRQLGRGLDPTWRSPDPVRLPPCGLTCAILLVDSNFLDLNFE